jgi:hypothetical protein
MVKKAAWVQPLAERQEFTMTLAEHEMPPSTAGSRGRLHAWRARWFGERDEVADQLADIARQGSGMARLAPSAPHSCWCCFRREPWWRSVGTRC